MNQKTTKPTKKNPKKGSKMAFLGTLPGKKSKWILIFTVKKVKPFLRASKNLMIFGPG